MIDIPKINAEDESRLPAWWFLPGDRHILLRQPCGHTCYLPHEVSEAGGVNPSVVCPVSACFHDFVRLLGWIGPALPRRNYETWVEEWRAAQLTERP